jgi:hypothetical protein
MLKLEQSQLLLSQLHQRQQLRPRRLTPLMLMLWQIC